MKVTQEKLPASQIGLQIEIPAETSQKTYERVVKDLARTANVPGFRKGKVPRQILLQRLGSQRVKAAALEEIIQQGLQEALQKEDIQFLGNYKLRSNFDELVEQYRPGEAVAFLAAVDVPPSVELGDYKNLRVRAEETPYDPQRVNQWLEERQAQQATLVPVEDRPAQMGDVAVVDYQGRFAGEAAGAGEPIPGVQASDFRVELVEGRFIEGMVEGIVGMELDQTQEVSVTFPQDYPREDLAGKAVTFTITLKELKAKELPELDDEFAEEVSEFETLAELRESLERQFQEQAAQETKNSIQKAIVAELIATGTVDLPETLIGEEVTQILTQTAMQMQRMGIEIKQLFTPDKVPQMRQNARPEAIERLKASLILAEIARVEAITPDPEAVKSRLDKLKDQLANSDVDLEQLTQMVEEELQRERTLDWLQERTEVELVPAGTLTAEESPETGQEEE